MTRCEGILFSWGKTMPDTTELTLEERVARLEQEVAELKQARPQARFSEPPTRQFLSPTAEESVALLDKPLYVPPHHLFEKLRDIWGLAEVDASDMSLEEAQELLAQGLPPNWASREIIRARQEDDTLLP